MGEIQECIKGFVLGILGESTKHNTQDPSKTQNTRRK